MAQTSFFGGETNQIKVGAALIICNGDIDAIRKNLSPVYEITGRKNRIALGMIRASKQTSDWRLIEEYRRKKTEKGSGRAIIALTRKIARIVFVMLENRETFNPDLMLSK